jgi:hypothetical protein
MPKSNANLVAAANAMRALETHAQLHTGAAGASGTSNVSAAPRVAATWTAPTGPGSYGLAAPLLFTGGTPNGPVAEISFWNGASGGTFQGSYKLAGDATFNAAGEYTVNPGDITGASTDANA